MDLVGQAIGPLLVVFMVGTLLGLGTRNVGAAFAPLVAAPGWIEGRW